MGPGPDGPGKPQRIADEIAANNRFNGAGAGWPRKTGGGAEYAPAGWYASMGPGPDGPGKQNGLVVGADGLL